MSRENVEIVRRMMELNTSGAPERTVEAALSLADPAMEFRSRVTAVEGSEYLGHEGVRRYFADLGDTFREWRNEAEAIEEVSPDAVLVEARFKGIARSSGVEIELRSAIVFVISEGKCIRIFSYPTRAEALEAAGLSE